MDNLIKIKTINNQTVMKCSNGIMIISGTFYPREMKISFDIKLNDNFINDRYYVCTTYGGSVPMYAVVTIKNINKFSIKYNEETSGYTNYIAIG